MQRHLFMVWILSIQSTDNFQLGSAEGFFFFSVKKDFKADFSSPLSPRRGVLNSFLVQKTL